MQQPLDTNAASDQSSSQSSQGGSPDPSNDPDPLQMDCILQKHIDIEEHVSGPKRDSSMYMAAADPPVFSPNLSSYDFSTTHKLPTLSRFSTTSSQGAPLQFVHADMSTFSPHFSNSNLDRYFITKAVMHGQPQDPEVTFNTSYDNTLAMIDATEHPFNFEPTWFSSSIMPYSPFQGGFAQFGFDDMTPPKAMYDTGMQLPRLAPPRPASSESTSTLASHRVSCRQAISQELALSGASQEAWPCFRCNPPADKKTHHRTSRDFLDHLEYAFESFVTFGIGTSQVEWIDYDTVTEDCVEIEPFQDKARDKLMGFIERFLEKAQASHGSIRNGQEQPYLSLDLESVAFPRAKVLEYFLRAFAHYYEPYFGVIPGCTLSLTDMMQSQDAEVFSLLILLMIAQGATTLPTDEARQLKSGLVEACRLALSELVEKEHSMSANLVMLQSALLFVNMASWSGDNLHMKVCG